MKRQRHTPEEIIKKLREAATLLAGGQSVEEACKKLEVSPPTYHRWRQEYGGAKEETVRRLKELEKENTQLKKLAAMHALLQTCNRGRKNVSVHLVGCRFAGMSAQSALCRQGEERMIYGLTNSKGGVGKTTIAVHLAAFLAKKKRRVVFIDADPQQSASTWIRELALPIQLETLPNAER